jgi:hypothetical protein
LLSWRRLQAIQSVVSSVAAGQFTKPLLCHYRHGPATAARTILRGKAIAQPACRDTRRQIALSYCSSRAKFDEVAFAAYQESLKRLHEEKLGDAQE